MENLIVQKYGGTSVGSFERIEAVADNIANTHKNGKDVVVVLSAMAGETDKLIQLAKSIQPEPEPREYDALISTGEQISVALMAMALTKRGIKSKSYTAYQLGIKTNDRQLSIVRRVYSLLARYFVRLFFPVPKISEYTGGFRAYSLEIIQKAFKVYGGSFIQLGSFGFVCTFEKLIKLSLINAKFSEVPFELEYENKTAESKMVPWITILGYILLIPVIYWPKTGWKKRISKL